MAGLFRTGVIYRPLFISTGAIMQDLTDKYYNIQQASEIIGVKPHVLRFWESEFSELKPKKSQTGRRIYQKRDIAIIFKIKQLLYDEGFTIQGAKQKIKSGNKNESNVLPGNNISKINTNEFLANLRDSITDLNTQIKAELKNME